MWVVLSSRSFPLDAAGLLPRAAAIARKTQLSGVGPAGTPVGFRQPGDKPRHGKAMSLTWMHQAPASPAANSLAVGGWPARDLANQEGAGRERSGHGHQPHTDQENSAGIGAASQQHRDRIGGRGSAPRQRLRTSTTEARRQHRFAEIRRTPRAATAARTTERPRPVATITTATKNPD